MSSLREKELDIIHKFSHLMSKIFDFEELLEALVGTLSRHFECRRVSVLLIDDDGSPMIKMAQGFSNEDELVRNLKLDSIGPVTREVIKKKKTVVFGTKKDWLDAKFKLNKKYKTFAFLSVPILNNNDVKGIINIAEPAKKKSFSKDDIRMLEIISVKIGFTLETIKLHKQIVGNEVYKKELEIGRDLQLSLLPSEFPKNENIDISLCSFPAMLVGGDYYDFIDAGKDKLMMAIGDISGKGVSASILMASLRALVRTSLPRSKNNLSKSMTDINRFLYKDLGENHYYSTLILGSFDFKKMAFRFINAGHNYPLMYKFSDGSVTELKSASTHFLGFFDDVPLCEEEIPIENGDFFVFFTDGLVENRGPDNVIFDEESLKALLGSINPSQSAKEIKEKIHNAFRVNQKHQPLNDDYTIIVVRIT